MAIPRAVLFFACVPRPPAVQADALAARWGRLGGPVSVRARAYAKQAEEADDPEGKAAAMALYSDSLLLKGDLARAREILEALEPSVAARLSVRRRLAVLAMLDGAGDADAQLARLHTESADDPFEHAVTGILLARARPDAETLEPLHEHLSTLRGLGEIDALCRLALVAGDAWLARNEPHHAMSQALRSLAHGRNSRDRDLARNAKIVVDQLMGSPSGKGVDDLVRVALDLGHETSLERVLARIAQSTLELTGADRAFVLLNGETGLDVVASAFRPGHSGRPSLTIAERTLHEGRELVTPDVGDADPAGAAESVVAMQLRMVLCIPMSDRVRVLGAIYADSQRAETQELEDMAWLVRAFAAHAVVALRNAELLGAARHNALQAREVVHDVRNLANGMRLGLEELTEELDLPDWATETLRQVRAMNDLLLGTVGALLASEAVERTVVDLADLLRRTADLMRFEARAHTVEIRTALEPAQVLGTERELARVAANLLGNALKYSPPNGVVRIGLATADGRARFTVSDDGPGIPEDQLEIIFGSGTQADGAKHGFGLGLGICRHIVHAHGGTISARNGSRGGAVFEVSLPSGDLP